MTVNENEEIEAIQSKLTDREIPEQNSVEEVNRSL